MMHQRVLYNLVFWLVLFTILCAFELAFSFSLISPAALAKPSEIPKRLIDMLIDGSLPIEGARTIFRAISGFSIGFPIGTLFAVVIFLLGSARLSGEFLLDFIRSIPVSCLVPLIIAIVGVDSAAHICMAAIGVSTITAVTVLRGLTASSDRFATVIRLYKPSMKVRMLSIVIPGASSFFAAALKLSVSSALVLVILAEMFMGSSAGGLGRLIGDKTYGDDRPGQFAAILFAGIVGFLFNLIVNKLTSFLLGRPNDQQVSA